MEGNCRSHQFPLHPADHRYSGHLKRLEVFRQESLLRSIDFSTVLMQGMLSLLLFAGALQVDLSELRAYRWQVAQGVEDAQRIGGGST